MPVIKQDQNMLDMVVQYSGSLDNLFTVALQNSLSATDSLTAGNSLQEMAVTNKRVVNLFARKEYDVNTVLRPILTLGGIGYMQIGTSFKVS